MPQHIPRKRFGQNFLLDHNIINNIIAYLRISDGEHFVEIGPGQGALTIPLLQNDIKLDIVELDRDLVNLLSNKFESHSNLTIHSADALRFDFTELAQNHEKLRVIGNLPYNISTPLMFHLLDNANCIQDMHFMLQKEVVDRICAEPGSKKYGRLSIMMQYYCRTELLFDVPPESFNPPPKVMSAIVKLTPYERPPVRVDDVNKLNKVVTQAFSQRRKTLQNALKKLIDAQDIIDLGIDSSLRPEFITLSEFAQLSHLLPDN